MAASRINIDTGTGYKSFVGMAERNGRLHLVYRHGTDHFTAADGIVKMTYSDDLGVTWSSPTTIASIGGRDLRDPSIFCTAAGRLIVGFDDTLHTGPTYSVLKVIYSDDGGATWSSPYTVTTSGMGYECAGTAPIIQAPDGTLLLPAFGENLITGPFFSVLFQSTDDGATWGTQTTIASGGGNQYVEPYLRAVGSDVYCFCYDPFAATVYRVISSDNGDSWGSPVSVLSANGRTDWYPFTSTSFVMWCRDPGGNEARWTVSTDSGATWDTLRDIDDPGDLYMYGAPVRVGGVIVHAYSLEVSSTDADLYCRTYTPTG
jgi:hypothetical protein